MYHNLLLVLKVLKNKLKKKKMFSETMTLISNAQDEFLCSLPSFPTAFWAQLPVEFLISVPKTDHISFPPLLSHRHPHTSLAGGTKRDLLPP